MTKKKKKSAKAYQALSAVPFVGEIPILQDGTAIKQPIIQEESNKVQQVSLTNSIPPLDMTLKQVDFTTVAQTSSLNVNTNPQSNIYLVQTTTTFFTLETESFTTAGHLEATVTVTDRSRLVLLNWSMNIKAGTISYGDVIIKLYDGTTLIGYFDKAIPEVSTSLGTSQTITPNDQFIIPAGCVVELWIRKESAACTAQGSLNLILQRI